MDVNWGSLGHPVGKRDQAHLLHVRETSAARLRHAFYRSGARVVQEGLGHPAILYRVGGPVSDAETGQEIFQRRLTYLPAGYEGTARYEGNSHVLALELTSSRYLSIFPGGAETRPVPLIAPFYGSIWDILIMVATGTAESGINSYIRKTVPYFALFVETRPLGWLGHLLDTLHLDWHNPPLLDELAETYGKSKQHICRTFKAATGTTVHRYSMMIRLDYARGLIWCTDLPLGEIASAVGFTDQSHLTRALSMHHAITPRRLRLAVPCMRRDRFFVGEALE